MPSEIKHIDTFQTRFFQSFVNLTKQDSTTYPATSAITYTNYPGTQAESLTSICIYDQFALRVSTAS
jgi:hypothetical protein